MSKSSNKEIVEAVIVKDNDGKKARQKVQNRRKFADVVVPILTDIILLVFGVCLLIWADKVTNFISITIGIIFILYGVYNFIDYIRAAAKEKRSSSIIVGIGLVIAGAFLCTQTGFIKEAISFIIGIFIILISLVRLSDAMRLRTFSNAYRWPMMLSIIGIIAGVLCIIGKIMISDIFIQILGVMLIIFAVSNIANSLALNRLKK